MIISRVKSGFEPCFTNVLDHVVRPRVLCAVRQSFVHLNLLRLLTETHTKLWKFIFDAKLSTTAKMSENWTMRKNVRIFPWWKYTKILRLCDPIYDVFTNNALGWPHIDHGSSDVPFQTLAEITDVTLVIKSKFLLFLFFQFEIY